MKMSSALITMTKSFGCLIIDKKRNMLGIITDGDLRRKNEFIIVK